MRATREVTAVINLCTTAREWAPLSATGESLCATINTRAAKKNN